MRKLLPFIFLFIVVMCWQEYRSLAEYCGAPKFSDIVNFISGQQKIVSAIKMAAFKDENAWSTYGLKGVSLFPRRGLNYNVVVGYRSLFASGLWNSYKSKIELSISETFYPLDLNSETVDDQGSWIYQREYYISRIAKLIYDRFGSYSDYESKGKQYASNSNDMHSVTLKRFCEDAYKFYIKTKKRGFDDRTLGNAIGLGYGTLVYDGIIHEGNVFALPEEHTKYKKIISDSIYGYKDGFSLSKLSNEMARQGLFRDDIIAFPSSKEQHQAIVQLIKEDLNKQYWGMIKLFFLIFH